MNQAQGLGQGSNQLTTNALNRALLGTPSSTYDPKLTEEAWLKGVYLPGMRAIEEEAIPLMKDTLSLTGSAYSSRLAEKGRRVFTDFNRSAVGILAQMQRDDSIRAQALKESAAQRSLEAVPLAQKESFMPTYRAQAMTSALAPFQAYDQSLLDAKRREYYQVNPWLGPALGFTGQSQLGIYDNQAQLSPWGQLVGEGMKAAGTVAGAAAASDKRLKKNIKYITKGWPVELATWEWNDKDYGPTIGFIAQDVLKVFPELVVNVKGILHVLKAKVLKEVLRCQHR